MLMIFYEKHYWELNGPDLPQQSADILAVVF